MNDTEDVMLSLGAFTSTIPVNVFLIHIVFCWWNFQIHWKDELVGGGGEAGRFVTGTNKKGLREGLTNTNFKAFKPIWRSSAPYNLLLLRITRDLRCLSKRSLDFGFFATSVKIWRPALSSGPLRKQKFTSTGLKVYFWLVDRDPFWSFPPLCPVDREEVLWSSVVWCTLFTF